MDALAELREIVTRHARPRRARVNPLPRLHLAFGTTTTLPTSVVATSTLALVIQGAKRTGIGARTFDYGAGHLLITTVRAPVSTRVTRASVREPYLGVGLTLQPALVAAVLLKAPARPPRETPFALATSKASEDLLDAFRRYVRLLDAPEDIPLLAEAIEREIVWRVMKSSHGASLRESGLATSNLTRVSKAIDVLQTRFAEPLAVAALARTASMSTATFNRHFRKVTGMSPLQFQKQLRLQHARTRLLAREGDVSSVSFGVGYKSPSQFSHDYRRQFGMPPGEDAARWHHDQRRLS